MDIGHHISNITVDRQKNNKDENKSDVNFLINEKVLQVHIHNDQFSNEFHGLFYYVIGTT